MIDLLLKGVALGCFLAAGGLILGWLGKQVMRKIVGVI